MLVGCSNRIKRERKSSSPAQKWAAHAPERPGHDGPRARTESAAAPGRAERGVEVARGAAKARLPVRIRITQRVMDAAMFATVPS
jgi:hypothetical protein